MKNPRVGLVGPLLGGNPGWVTSQGEVLAEQLEAAGWTLRTVSGRPGRMARLVDTVGSLVRWRSAVDLVVCMVFSGRGFAMADVASALAVRLRKPLVLWLHGGGLPAFAARHPLWARRVFRRADHIVSPSTYLVDSIPGLEATILPNILSVSEYRCDRGGPLRPRLLWMRTFHELYHPELAVRAFARLTRSFPEAELTMAGQDRGLLATTRSLARHLGVEERVSFPGFLQGERKREALRHHDIFLNTNRVDNMPVSVLEAAAAGLVIVATRVGGIPALVQHERSALLVADDDAESMAAAVERLLRDAALACRLREAALALAADCDAERVRPRWEALLRSVAQGHMNR